MIVKNIRTNFDLVGELIDSESLTYLLIKFNNGAIKFDLIDYYRDIDYPEDTLEQFRERVLCSYEVSRILEEIKEQEKNPTWERDSNWWKNKN